MSDGTIEIVDGDLLRFNGHEARIGEYSLVHRAITVLLARESAAEHKGWERGRREAEDAVESAMQGDKADSLARGYWSIANTFETARAGAVMAIRAITYAPEDIEKETKK